jgi:hypothetical protein
MLQTTIGGRYKIVRQLGYGGFGETYLAQELLLPEQDWCVVKKLQPQSEDEFVLQTARRLFEAEAKVLNMLGKHECIPTLLAHFEEQGQFYLVQEFIEGESLEQEMRSGKWGNVPAVIDFLTDILRTLEFVHQQGVIHRDIKPAQLQNYFSLQSWYVPRYSSKDFPKDLLSATEVSNMELIRDFKQQRIEKRKQNPDRCLVGVRIVSDLEAPLAVRSLPSANSTVVSKLDNGARVRVVQETNGWLQIDQPLAGWVIASRTEPICQD